MMVNGLIFGDYSGFVMADLMVNWGDGWSTDGLMVDHDLRLMVKWRLNDGLMVDGQLFSFMMINYWLINGWLMADFMIDHD